MGVVKAKQRAPVQEIQDVSVSQKVYKEADSGLQTTSSCYCN